jgi:hypothetical protein
VNEPASSVANNKRPHRSSVGISVLTVLTVLNGAPFVIVKLDPTALAHRKLKDDVVAPGTTGVIETVNVYGNGVDVKGPTVATAGAVPDAASTGNGATLSETSVAPAVMTA